MKRKLCDIEDALVWAAGELARQGRPGQRAPLRALVGRHDAELLGHAMRPASFPSVAPMWRPGIGREGGFGDPPHADALIVGEAIERLRFAPPPCAMSEADLTFGLGFALDAAGALRTALANVANLMLVHGRLASRPPLRLEPPEPRAKLAPNGKPGAWRREVWAEPTFGDHTQAQREVEVAVSALKRRNHYPDGAFGVVEWEPRPQELVDERAEYAAWRAGLEWLAAGLAGALETRTVLPPRAAWRPWAGDVEAEPLRDLFAPGALGVHDATEAAQFEASRATGRRRPIAGGSVYGFAPGKPGRGGREA